MEKFFKYDINTDMFPKKEKAGVVNSDAPLSELAIAPETKEVERFVAPTEEGKPLSLNDIGTFEDIEMTKLLIQRYGSIGTRGRSFSETIKGVNTAEEIENKIIDEGLEQYSPSQLSYMREGFEDRMNSIERFLADEESSKVIYQYLNPNTTDEDYNIFAQSQADEYAKLEVINQATLGALATSMSNVGFIRRNITAKAHNVLLDVMDMTDIGDIASGIRLGAVTSAVLTGGATEFTLAGLKSVALLEGSIGAIEGTVDTMRELEADPDKNVATTFAKNWGINTALNIGTRYAFAGIFKGIKAASNKVKAIKGTNVEDAISDAMGSPNIISDGSINLKANELTGGYITPDVESVPLIRATENAYDDFLGGGYGGKITASAGAKEGEMIIDTFEDINSVYFGEKSLMMDVGGTVPTERGALAEAVEEYAKRNGIKNLTPEKNLSIAGEPEVINVARRKIMTLKEQSMEHYQNVVFNQGREVSEYAQINKLNIENISSPTSESSRAFVENIQRGFKDANRVVNDQLYSKIVALGGEDGINNISDFYGIAKSLDIDIDKALYKGALDVEAPEGFKKVFSYLRQQYNGNVVGAKPSMIYTGTEEIYQIAQEMGIEKKLFKISDFTPEGWDFANTPLVIDPNINPEVLRGIVNDQLTPKGIIESLTEDMGLNQVTASPNAIKELEKIVNVDGKIAKPKQVADILRADGIPESTANAISRRMEKIDNLRKADQYKMGNVINAINEEIKVRQGMENRIFSFASKKDILSAKGFRVEKTGTVAERYMPLDEAMEKLSPSDQKLYKELVEDFTKSTNGVDANAENLYNLLNIERASGKSTAGLDIRTSTMGDVAKARGVKWNDLTPEAKVQYAEKVLNEDVLPQQIKKIGENNMARNGVKTAEENIEFYLAKWEASDQVTVNITRGAKEFGAGVTEPSAATGGKYVFRMDIPNGMDEVTAIGVTRHELQHIYDHKFLGEVTDNSFRFKNKPTLKGTDVEFKIKNGEKVSIREAVGDYYNNHFYSVADDNFESSYLTAQMRDRYNSLTPEDRFQGFLTYLERSRKNIREGKVSTKQLFQYSSGDVPLEEFGMMEAMAGKRVVQDGFALKTFRNHADFEDFIFRTSDRMGKRMSDGNRALRFMEKIDAIKDDAVKRQLGYSKNDIIDALNPNKIGDMLHKQGLSGKAGDNVRKVIQNYKTALQTTGKLYGETVPEFTKKNVIEGYVSNMLIGNRWFKDSISANVSLTGQYINNGQYGKAFVEMFKLLPNTAKYFAQSTSRMAGNVAINIDDFTRYLISDLGGIHYEARWLAHAGDYLVRVGDIGNKNLSVNKIYAFNSDMLKLATEGAGLSEKSFIGFSKRLQARNLAGLVADDTVGNIQAKGWAKQELLSMLEAPSYDALSTIQKKMYAFSGFKRESFGEFVETVSKQAELTKGMDFIPSNFTQLRNTLNAGVNELDLVGRVQNGIKSERNSFNYMMSTTLNMLKDTMNKISVKSYNGVYMNKALDKEMFSRVAGYGMVGAIGASQVAGAKWLYTSIKNREAEVASMDDAYRNFKKSPVKFSASVLDFVTSETPLGMITSSGKAVSLAGTAGIETIVRSAQKGLPDFTVTAGSAIYGATATKLIKDFALKNGEKKTSSYVASPKFKNDLNKQFKNNFIQQYPNIHKQSRGVYQDELRRDKDIYNFTRPVR